MDRDEQRREGRAPGGLRRFGAGRFLALALVCGGGLGWLGAMGCASARRTSDLDLVSQAYNSIQSHYVDRSAVQSKELTYGAISGMVEALGDTGHSTFLTPEMVKELKSMERGELKGIGIEVEMKNGQVTIVAPIDGSPAQKAGLRSGEVIIKVAGQDIADWSLGKVVEKILGPSGSVVRLTLQEPHNGHVREVALKRAAIKLHEVSWQRLPGTEIAHVRVATLRRGWAGICGRPCSRFRRTKLRASFSICETTLEGFLEEAIAVASQFLTNGNVVLTKDAKGETTPGPVETGGLATDLPLVVLINQGSASAAEIVAGALQDRNRAALVGETTFGTGTVLQEFNLSRDGSALLLAVGEWLTPNGHSFWHKGLTPEYVVPLPPEVSPLVPSNEGGLTPKDLSASDDRQLLTALRLLSRHKQSSEVGALDRPER